jgi:decaprenyl-phosphate phosphoribosyltransferase
MTFAMALLRALRPRQWVKNLLVGAAPLAAGSLFEASVLWDVTVAFACFCAASSAGYLLNDVVDADADRNHPAKSARPVAAGVLTPARALLLSAVLAVLSVVGTALSGSWQLAAVIVVYLVLTASYSLWLKHQAVIDLAVVSGGFLLRAAAGGAAAEIPLSRWFLIVAAFGSLFMVAGKRYSELITLGDSGTRASLVHYTPGYLRFVWGIAAAVTVMAYCLWAFEVENPQSSLPWGPLSVVPFVVALLRYGVDIDQGLAGEPERIVLGDRALQVLGLAWIVVFALGAFGV